MLRAGKYRKYPVQRPGGKAGTGEHQGGRAREIGGRGWLYLGRVRVRAGDTGLFLPGAKKPEAGWKLALSSWTERALPGPGGQWRAEDSRHSCSC